jgi:hypothetical protein
MTDQLMSLRLGSDVGEKIAAAQRCAKEVKLHPFEVSYDKELERSLQELGRLLIEIGYLVPIEPRNPSHLDIPPVSMLKDSTKQKVRRPCYGGLGDRTIGR